MNYFLKLFGWVLILALAAAVGAVSIFFNYRYGQAQGGTGVDGQLQGGVFALADAFKLCLPVLITTAWTPCAARNWRRKLRRSRGAERLERLRLYRLIPS